MSKYGFLVTIMLIILIARPVSSPPKNEEILPSPATRQEPSCTIIREEISSTTNQFTGLEKKKIVLPVDHRSSEENVPSKANPINLNLFAPEGQLGFSDSDSPPPDPLDYPALEPAVNFLLLGHRNSIVETLIVVSLIPGQTASLLAVYPDNFKQGNDNGPIEFSPVSVDSTSRAELIACLEKISGKKIDFVVGLNLEGVIEMVDLMGGVELYSYTEPTHSQNVEGYQAVDLLTRKPTPAREKQRLLRALLLKASTMEFTKVGLTLLKIGYHNLNTDLSVADLINLRKVTHTISPYQVIFQELP